MQNLNTLARWPLFLGLVVAGLLGNHFKFALFLNIDVLFGSVFAMLALQFFGLGRGVVAAALVASYTFVLWNHPYAIVIMTAEVAVVGTLMARYKMGMLLADTLYWLALGMPLVFVFYALVMKLPMSSVEIIMVKQAVNGVANALFARLLFAGFSRSAGSTQLPLHELVGNLLTAFLLFPALLMLAVGSRTDFAELDLQIRNTLQQRSQSVTSHLSDWVQDRTRVVLSLTELAATLTPQQMQGRLEQARAADASFLRIGLRDTESVIAAYAPPLDESGQSNIGKKFPERPYIAELKKTLQPMLAEVVVGRINQAEPVVILLAPVVRQGQYAGYVNSVLRLDALRNNLHSHIESGTLLYSLLDSKGNTILSNRPDQQIMKPFVRSNGALQDLDATLKRWLPVLPPNTSIADQWKNSFYVAQTTVGALGGWQLVLEQPVAPYQKILYDNYANKLTLLFVILLATLALAELVSRRTTVALDQLGVITHDLPEKLANGNDAIVWPQSRVAQTQQLVVNFRVMAESLVQKFRDINHMNASLETRVAERTQQLDALVLEQKTILNSSLVGIVTAKERKIVWANLRFETMMGYAAGELAGTPTRQVYASHEDYVRFGEAAYPVLAQGQVYRSRIRQIRKDGAAVWTDVSGVMLHAAKGESLWCFNDITKQVQAETKLRASELHLKTIVDNEPECINVVDAQGRLLQMNPAGLAMVEADSESQVVGLPVLDVIAPEHRAAFAAMHQRVIAGEHMQLAFEVLGLKGGRRWLETHAVPMQEHGQTVHLAVSRDITVRKQMQDQVRQLAFYDSLTTLANRRLFNDRLAQALLAGKRSGGYCALLFLDLDNFKPLNDAHGHAAGDLLLVEVALRMKTCVREVDTVGRFGGDEFVVLLSELTPDRATSTAEAARVAEKIRSALEQPYRLGLVEHQCSASIGVTIIDASQTTAEEAIHRADKAMYDAKAHGRNQVWLSEG